MLPLQVVVAFRALGLDSSHINLKVLGDGGVPVLGHVGLVDLLELVQQHLHRGVVQLFEVDAELIVEDP